MRSVAKISVAHRSFRRMTVALGGLAFGFSVDALAGPQTRLRVDPLLLADASEVWDIITAPNNPIWPGWNANDTPILFYQPGVQDVLIGHPKPPEGFVPYIGPLTFRGRDIVVKDGPTILEWDGQNTSTDVNGVETLVLADTLSNKKQSLSSLLDDPRPTDKILADMRYEDIGTDPYEQMAMITHEAFHVFQARSAPEKGANELDVRLYPCLSAANNVGFALEGKALADCIRATDNAAAREAALRWLAVRKERRAALPPQAIAYEDGNEYMEGLAKYTELRLWEVIKGRQPGEAMRWAQGFYGYDDLTPQREKRVNDLIRNMRGEVNVNNDPYGTAPLRSRLYYSGMAIAATLDRFAPDWKSRIFAADTSLAGLAEEALKATPDELRAALEKARGDSEYSSLMDLKTRLAEEGRKDTERMLAGITDGPNTLVEIDYTAFSDPKVGLSFTGFGVRMIDEQRTIYTMVPISARIAAKGYGFHETMPTPTLEDRAARRFQFQLAEKITRERVAEMAHPPATGPWIASDLKLELPGAQIMAKRAEIAFEGNKLRVKLLPAD